MYSFGRYNSSSVRRSVKFVCKSDYFYNRSVNISILYIINWTYDPDSLTNGIANQEKVNSLPTGNGEISPNTNIDLLQSI